MIFQIFLLTSVGRSFAQDTSAGGWKQISTIPVCVTPRDNGYGNMMYYQESKLVAALKLKFHSGQIRCSDNEAYNSKWGCGDSRTYPLNIIVTDESNHVIFPLPQYIKANGMWYYLPLVDPIYSDELVFVDFAHPLYLKEFDRLRFWYGEDLSKTDYMDNQGRVCFHVLARFM